MTDAGTPDAWRQRWLEDRLKVLEDDIREARNDCRQIREWVERREAEKERLSAGWWVAIIGGSAIFLSSIVTAVATLAGG